jgi:hypothetical protein
MRNAEATQNVFFHRAYILTLAQAPSGEIDILLLEKVCLTPSIHSTYRELVFSKSGMSLSVG